MATTIDTAVSGHGDHDVAEVHHPDLIHPDLGQVELVAVLQALSDPIRLQVVTALADGEERSCSSFDLPVVKSTCTHHFRVLREAGLIRQRVEGKTKWNALRREELDRRFPGLLASVLGASDRG